MRFLHREVQSLEDATRNFEQIEEQLVYDGSGAPTFPAPQGAFYLRHDTPSTANQRVYINTAIGSHWIGIL